MDVFINSHHATALPAAEKPLQNTIMFLSADEFSQMHNLLPDMTTTPAPLDENEISRFESYPHLDYIVLTIPDFDQKDKIFSGTSLQIYFSARRLVFVCTHTAVLQPFITRLQNQAQGGQTLLPGGVLCQFWLFLTEKDSVRLNAIEEEIAGLEDSLIDSKELKYSQEISRLRKRLLRLKRYYELLFDLLEDLEENQNGLLGDNELRTLHLTTNRADRLYHMVMNLRDYVTQIRESYQAEIDLSLNEIMKFFTVITAIFLPLSLIVGWYGMNLKMPELDWIGMYPAVVGASAVVILGIVAYFKRKKWM